MKKKMTLAEAREFFKNESCFETETGFLLNVFGKYCPNITFVLPKEFDLGKDGKPVSPLRYIEDKEVTDNMNVDFDGDASFIFGDFWRSKKGGACFRPKNPTDAKHLLIGVSWGGCFDSHRGSWNAGEIDGVLYFRRASSNGGGAGTDWWVVPVGFHRSYYDPEFDGDTKPDQTAADFELRAKPIREKHAKLQKAKIEEADAFLKKKAAEEAVSMETREKYLPRLQELQVELVELSSPRKFHAYCVDEIASLGEAYFKWGSSQYLYTEENVSKIETYLCKRREYIEKTELEYQAKADARATFEPRFEELRSQIERLGWELSLGDKEAKVTNPAKERDSRYYYDTGVTHYPYTLDGVTKLREEIKKEADRLAEEELRARNTERINQLLSGTELPEELWFLFEESEDTDSDILNEIKAIFAAKAAAKDTMDEHELCVCGFERRCNAIHRVLSRVGGGKAKLNIGTQAGSKALAWYIAG